MGEILNNDKFAACKIRKNNTPFPIKDEKFINNLLHELNVSNDLNDVFVTNMTARGTA